jgi:hypothetical protein
MYIRLACLIMLLLHGNIVAKPTTFDGKHDLSTINLIVVYFVPQDRTPLPDWNDRVSYFVKRIVAFHHRELDQISTVKATIHPKPLMSGQSTAYFRRGDQNRTFFDTMDDVKALLKWKPTRDAGFPVLLVLSDFNWRELDDFTRLRIVDGKPVHEGHIAGDGRHFPGAESGGSRATYIDNPGYGMGLVSADGWRVPYSGTDCVVYHEGLGHSIGLPHPTPIDDSVMGTGQYTYWINQTRLIRSQKLKLGWNPPEKEVDRSANLFTHFTAIPKPNVPTINQEVLLKLTWPKGATIKSLVVRTQTSVVGPWKKTDHTINGKPTEFISLGKFATATPVSYRVDVRLEDDQTTELWGYFQVKPK